MELENAEDFFPPVLSAPEDPEARRLFIVLMAATAQGEWDQALQAFYAHAGDTLTGEMVETLNHGFGMYVGPVWVGPLSFLGRAATP